MIKCNLYQVYENHILLYGEDPKLPEELENFKLIREDVDPSDGDLCDYPLCSIKEFMSFERGRDRILSSEGIDSFLDISSAYFLLKNKRLNKSRRIREMVEQKYIDIIELIKNEDFRKIDTEM